jgi:aspartate racemase
MNNHIESNMSNVRPLFGIIGGMGPLSSAQFVNSLYGYCLDKFVVEQDYPRIIMISDPIILDRAEAIKNNKAHLVISSFEEKIEGLTLLGVNEIIIVCVTAHLYLDRLNTKSKKRITDIVKLLYSELDKQLEQSLILSSMAVYDNQVISHPKAIYPSQDDVQLVQDFILKIKLNYSSDLFSSFIQLVGGLSLKYQTKSIVFACTELHLANVFVKNHSLELSYNIIDPLEIAANYIIQNNIPKG